MARDEGGKAEGPLSAQGEKEDEMPKFILATVALFLGRQGPSGATAHDAMHARTRSRDATRRLRASRTHDPYFHLSSLGLNKRH